MNRTKTVLIICKCVLLNHPSVSIFQGAGIACHSCRSASFVIERLRVQIPAEAAGEFSSQELSLSTDLFGVGSPVTTVARKRLRSFCQKCKWQVTPRHAYTPDPTKSEWADYAAVLCYQETSSHASCQETLSHTCLSSLNHRGLILA